VAHVALQTNFREKLKAMLPFYEGITGFLVFTEVFTRYDDINVCKIKITIRCSGLVSLLIILTPLATSNRVNVLQDLRKIAD